MFFGFLILFAAVIAWFIGLAMSPHATSAGDTAQHVRTVVAAFLRKSAIGNLVLCALSAWLLWPLRRTPMPVRDWTIIAIIAVIAATSLYQLFWLRSVVQ